MIDPALRVRLFGPGRIEARGHEVSAAQGVMGLLAFLLLQDQACLHRDRVAAELWSDVPEDRARRRLSTALWRLRRSVEEPTGATFVSVDGHGIIRVDVRCLDVDALQLEAIAREVLPRAPRDMTTEQVARAQAAFESCRGDLLTSLHDEWVHAERARLEEGRRRLLGHVGMWFRSERPPAVAIKAIHELLEFEPAHEFMHRLLIELYARSGEPALARRQLEACRVALERRYGIAPSPQTSAAAIVGNDTASSGIAAEIMGLGQELAAMQMRLARIAELLATQVAPPPRVTGAPVRHRR